MLRPQFFRSNRGRRTKVAPDFRLCIWIIDLIDEFYRIEMKFSVIIATYNRADELPRTLESLKNLEVAESWEVIVVDNNSSDNTREVVESAVSSFPVPLRYLMEREQGRSAALNAGIQAAQGEILAIT